MKHFIYTFIIFTLITQNIYSQTNNSDNQSFSVKNFRINTIYNTELTSIKYSYDLVLSNWLEDYSSNHYYIYYRLKDGDKIVYTSPNKKHYVNAQKKYLKQWMHINIPYSNINIKAGKHTLLLEIYAQNNSKLFPIFFQKKILVDIPKLYNYNEQKIKISNFRAIANVKQNKLEGIKITFNSKFKYKSSQIKGSDEDINLAKYTFNVSLINTKDKSNIDFFKENIYKIEFTPNKLNNKHEFFIPLNNINLPKGKHNITASLIVDAYYQANILDSLLSNNFILNQPYLYIFNFELEDCSILDIGFDASSRLGRLFSKSYSNKGKGYPDVYWEINSAGITKFKSQTHSNVLNTSGKASIIITDTDPLNLKILDSDILNSDDLIGEIKLPNPRGNYSKTYNSKSFDYVSSASYNYTKSHLPELKNASISSKKSKYKGVSGFNYEMAYDIQYMSSNMSLFLNTFVKVDNNLQDIYHINISKDSQNINSTTTKIINNIFIPYVEIPKNCTNIGYTVEDNLFKSVKRTVVENKEITIPEINDISAKIINTSEYFKKSTNTYGILVPVKWEIPEFYKKSSKIDSELKLYLNNTFYGSVNINLNKLKNNEYRIYIPYYSLGNKYKGEINFNLNEQTSTVDYTVGKSDLKFSLPSPKIEEISIKSISLKKISYYDSIDSIYVKIYRDKKIVCESSKLKPSKKTKINKFVTNKIVSHKKDVITISVLKYNKYNKNKEMFSKDLTIEELIKRKKIVIKDCDCKKMIIKIF